MPPFQFCAVQLPIVQFQLSESKLAIMSGITFNDCKVNLVNITNAMFVRNRFMKVTGYRCSNKHQFQYAEYTE